MIIEVGDIKEIEYLYQGKLVRRMVEVLKIQTYLKPTKKDGKYRFIVCPKGGGHPRYVTLRYFRAYQTECRNLANKQ